MRTTMGFGAAAAALLALTGCGGDPATTSPGTTTTTSTASAVSAPATSSTASTTGSCGGFTAGAGGILQTFCNGSAVAKVTVGAAASKEISGGTCSQQSDQLALNFGVVAGPDFPAGSAKPDYVGALVPNGSSSPQAFTVRVDGSGGNVVSSTVSVSADKKTVSLGGKLLTTGDPVSVVITC